MSAIKVTLVRSQIGIKPKQRGTLRALGLGKIGSSNVLPDRPGALVRPQARVVVDGVVGEMRGDLVRIAGVQRLVIGADVVEQPAHI